jgi:hypothetical protein
MTVDIFFWYIFPLIVGVGALGWVAFDRRKDHRPHPGE